MNDEMSFATRLGIPEYEFRVVIGTTSIDYDPAKEDENIRKHGYSLESAAHLLHRLVFPFGESQPHRWTDGFLENGEVRHMHLSVDDGGKVVLMVTTMRPNETVRVISFRRASSGERETFRKLTGYSEP